MATYKGTFKSIFEDEIKIGDEYIQLSKIEIPLIQRDYAQGRKTADIQRVRERFVKALHDAVVGTPITLDFIYGDVDNDGKLIPLDGQQRLTTLFLLYWYAAKKEDVALEDADFLRRFSYDVRYSARDFCSKIILFSPSFESTISDEIMDQPWFPYEWKNDPTISSMLTMIDCIDDAFMDTDDIWASLEDGAISFFFLPIRDMGLTDELYIKMNSRGKPLTLFEHFKAELERNLTEIDEALGRRLALKIDVSWTDLLWNYRMDELTDDGFLRYFRFICDVIYYLDDDTPVGKDTDVFYLANRNFSKSCTNALRNAKLLESYFDCWVELEKEYGISQFFDDTFSRTHRQGSIIVDERYMLNLLQDCLWNYGEGRQFSLQRFILLFAVVQYLLHYDDISRDDFIRRIRVINNLVNNSEDDISNSTTRSSGNRMPAVIREVEYVITNGCLRDTDEKSFNTYQMMEEEEKIEFVDEQPELAETLYRAEDHDLLYGQISILGLEHIELYERFEALFKCDWDYVDCALMAVGDYKQEEKRGRYQLGSSSNATAWQTLFHRSSAIGFENTKEILFNLLSKEFEINNDNLKLLSDDYLLSCERCSRYDWRYYYIKYDSFRPGRYGKYIWDDFNGDPFGVVVLHARAQLSSNAYNPFLKELDIYKNTTMINLGRQLYIYDNRAVLYEDSMYVLYSIDSIDGEEIYNQEDDFSIAGDGKYDTENRIESCREWLEDILGIVKVDEDNRQSSTDLAAFETNNENYQNLRGKRIAKVQGGMAGVIVASNDEFVTVRVYSGAKAGQNIEIRHEFLAPSKGIYVIGHV